MFGAARITRVFRGRSSGGGHPPRIGRAGPCAPRPRPGGELGPSVLRARPEQMIGSKSRMQGKVSLERSAATVYVGVDVCKAWLDVYLHPVGRQLRVANTREGLKRLKRALADHQVARIVMEATGKYHREAHRSLHASGFIVAIVNPLR